MNLRLKIAIGLILLALSVGIFAFALPSLIGFLLTCLIMLAIYDFIQRRRRNAARTFNSALRTVCHRQGAISKVVTAFARQGPLRGPCYEYARRLMVGEEPVQAAANSRVPLQLGTAVAMRTATPDAEHEPEQRRPDLIWTSGDSGFLPAYSQILYLTLTAFITCMVLTFVTVFVVPTIEQMFREFSIDNSYQWLLVGTTPTWILLTVLAAMLLLMVPILARTNRFAIPVLNWLPVSPQAAQSRADMFGGLADAIDSGMPFANAIDLAREISIVPGESSSLRKAATSIQQGASAADTLYQNGWIDGEELSWLRDTPPHRFAQLLRHFGQQGVRDARANLQWLMGIMFPVFVLMLGAAVLFYVYGFFGTLMKLIGALS